MYVAHAKVGNSGGQQPSVALVNCNATLKPAVAGGGGQISPPKTSTSALSKLPSGNNTDSVYTTVPLEAFPVV